MSVGIDPFLMREKLFGVLIYKVLAGISSNEQNI